MRLVQIVPELPPAVGGVGDYAFLIAKALHRLNLETTFVIPDGHRPGWQPACAAEAPEVSLVPPRAGALARRLDALRPDAVLVHYSGYGYAKRGAAVWLARGLRRWKARAPGRRLVVMFHELWAYGPPWRSSYWTYPVQRALIAAILTPADAFLTSTALYAALLKGLAPDRLPVAVLPVLSNIGEPNKPPSFQAREPLAVVFGLPGMRARVYRHFEAFLPALHAAGIERVLDIGPPLDRRATDGPALPVTRCDYLEPRSASDTMLRARFGLLDYPPELAAKSGIFGAYTAHAVVPLVRGPPGEGGDSLRHGHNIVHTGEPIPDLQSHAPFIATRAYLWYREHRLERAAAIFARALAPSDAAP
jgi:Glycosyl transferase 4-like domain